MFVASESYSYATYDLGDCGCEGDTNIDRVLSNTTNHILPIQAMT